MECLVIHVRVLIFQAVNKNSVGSHSSLFYSSNYYFDYNLVTILYQCREPIPRVQEEGWIHQLAIKVLGSKFGI